MQRRWRRLRENRHQRQSAESMTTKASSANESGQARQADDCLCRRQSATNNGHESEHFQWHDYANREEANRSDDGKHQYQSSRTTTSERTKVNEKRTNKSEQVAGAHSFAGLPEPSSRREVKIEFRSKRSSHQQAPRASSRVYTKRRRKQQRVQTGPVDKHHCPATSASSRSQDNRLNNYDHETLVKDSCFGEKRSNLGALIELFERQVGLVEGDEFDRKRCGSVQIEAQFHAVKKGTTSEESSKDKNMRDIITPVKYEPNSTSDEEPTSSLATSDEESAEGGGEVEANDFVECDSLLNCGDEAAAGARSPRRTTPASSQRDPLERIRLCGAIQVLPSDRRRTSWHEDPTAQAQSQRRQKDGTQKRRQSLVRKLTATRWQAPTDWRKYEHKLLAQQQAAQRAATGARLCPRSNSALEYGTTSCYSASRGPPIVKHSTSSSKRLLKQLARLRRLEEPEYRVKRPASVAKVEHLIEQLERVTREWDEDEHLFDRAERRDYPLINRPARRNSETTRGWEEEQQQQELIDFGRRDKVDRIEQESIARSHSLAALNLVGDSDLHQEKFAEMSQLSKGSKIGPFSDRRFHDDLAVRRLSRSPSVSSVNLGRQYPMSYLLCSNAYTPPLPISNNRFSQEAHLHMDDLHFRTINKQPNSNTLPKQRAFEMPPDSYSNTSSYGQSKFDRQRPQVSQTKTTGSDLDRENPFLTTETDKVGSDLRGQCNCQCQCVHHLTRPSEEDDARLNQLDNREACHEHCPAFKQRPDSRVSFQVDSQPAESCQTGGGRFVAGGRSSADSGYLAPTNASSVSPGGNPLDYKSDLHNLSQDQQRQVFVETDLDAVRVADWCWINPNGDRTTQTPSKSPVEFCQAKWSQTPSRRRPKISIENPRSKSPLLRVSSSIVNDDKKPLKAAKLFVESDLDKEQKPVVVQTYWDSTRRRRRRLSEQELGCEYSFEEEVEEEEEDEKELGHFTRRPSTRDRRFVIVGDEKLGRSSDEETEEKDDMETRKRPDQAQTNNGIPKNSGLRFSIGEYKSLNRPNLKIL